MKTIIGLYLSFLGLFSLQAQAPVPGAPPEVRSAYVLSLKDFGSEDIAYLSLPQTAPEIAVVVLPGLTGLSKETKAKCDFLASQGFIVLALDLFNGQVPRDEAEALRMQSEVRADSAAKTIDAGRRFFAESPRFKTGKAVLMSWTATAAMALHVSSTVKDLSGLILVEPWLKKGEKIEHPKIPTLLVCSQNDPGGQWLYGELKAQGLDRKLLTPVMVPANPGFMVMDKSELAHGEIWGSVVEFIRNCAKNSPSEKGLFNKLSGLIE